MSMVSDTSLIRWCRSGEQLPDASELSWSTHDSLNRMNTSRYYCAAVALAQSIHVFGGIGLATNKAVKSVEKLDLDTMTWAPLPNMSDSRSAPGAAVSDHDSMIYVFGGDFNSAEKFNWETEQWTSIASLPTARIGCAAECLNNGIYVVGGNVRGSFLNSCDMYNPRANMWSQLPPMHDRRNVAATVVVDGFMYVIGGENRSGPLASAEVFDPINRVWTSLTPMTTPRRGCGAVAVGKCIIVLGGYNNKTGKLSSAEMYNIETETWSPFPSLRHPRRGCSAVFTRNTIYVLGGVSEEGAPDVETMVLPHALSLELPPVPLIAQDHTVGLANLRSWEQEATALKRDFQIQVAAARADLCSQMESEVERLEAKIQEIRRRTTEEINALDERSTLLLVRADEKIDDINERIGSLEAKVRNRRRASRAADPPRQLVCPITMELMVDPVLAADGHTYERVEIERFLANTPSYTHPRSPVTGAVLPSRSLFPNVAIRSQCREYSEANR